MSGENSGAPEQQVVDGTVVEEAPPTVPSLSALIPAGSPTVAVMPQVEASELVARLEVIKAAQEKAMVKDVDYGVIPGTKKPTLLKPGAEKLSVLFQLDVQIVNEKVWGPDDHLTVIARAVAFHAPSGTRLGYGEGVCTTREKKYAVRQQQRACPKCGKETIFESRREPEFFCWSKKGGCGAKFPKPDPRITDQDQGEVPNPDLPDLWNTVVKMAEKRARVDVVLAVTGASALFTQDIEDEVEGAPEEQATPPRDPLPVEKVNELGQAIGALGLTYKAIGLLFGHLGADWLGEESGDGLRRSLENLTTEQAAAMDVELQRLADQPADENPKGGEADGK